MARRSNSYSSGERYHDEGSERKDDEFASTVDRPRLKSENGAIADSNPHDNVLETRGHSLTMSYQHFCLYHDYLHIHRKVHLILEAIRASIDEVLPVIGSRTVYLKAE